MNNNEQLKLHYGGFQGSVKYVKQDGCWYGEILNIKAHITYEANSYAALVLAFYEAVQDYLESIQICV